VSAVDHEAGLRAALLDRLRADEGVQAKLAGRVWDEPPPVPAWPYLSLGRCESRPVPAEGCGVEHRLTLNLVCRHGGGEAARQIVAAVRAALDDGILQAEGVRTVSLRLIFADVFRTRDSRHAGAVMRLRAVTEAV